MIPRQGVTVTLRTAACQPLAEPAKGEAVQG